MINMEERLKKLLDKKKPKVPKRKLGNTTKVWTKEVCKKATIEVE